MIDKTQSKKENFLRLAIAKYDEIIDNNFFTLKSMASKRLDAYVFI